jgi:hypothetical protein
VQLRNASGRDRDKHGVAGANAAIIVTAPNIVAGDTVRAGEC